jgi:hypothetical protein
MREDGSDTHEQGVERVKRPGIVAMPRSLQQQRRARHRPVIRQVAEVPLLKYL